MAEGDSSRRRPSVPALIALAAVLGAVAMAAAAGLTWWSQPFDDSLTGRVDATASGAATLPELVPVALVVLAGLGATLATRGTARRSVGGLLVLAGLLVAVRAVMALGTAPAALAGGLIRPATAAAPPTGHPWGPLLAAAGGLAVVMAGLLVALGRGAGRRRTLGARYERRRPVGAAAGTDPSTAHAVPPQSELVRDATSPATGGAAAGGPATGTGADGAGEFEAHAVDWWNQLDSGADPTVGPAAGPVPPGSGRTSGRATGGPARPRPGSAQREADR